MDFGTLQQIWAGQPDNGRTPEHEEIDMQDTIARVLRRARTMRRKVLVRDIVEVTAAVGGAACFFWVATVVPTGWPWVAAALLDLGVGGVFIVDRIRRRARRPEPSDVRASLERSLGDVDHQMTLLGSVGWWYIGPLALGAALIIGGSAWDVRRRILPEVWPDVRLYVWATLAAALAVTGAAFWFVWWLNQRAVRRHLRPERDRIAELLAQLGEERWPVS
jgi:hypothetical protein